MNERTRQILEIDLVNLAGSEGWVINETAGGDGRKNGRWTEMKRGEGETIIIKKDDRGGWFWQDRHGKSGNVVDFCIQKMGVSSARKPEIAAFGRLSHYLRNPPGQPEERKFPSSSHRNSSTPGDSRQRNPAFANAADQARDYLQTKRKISAETLDHFGDAVSNDKNGDVVFPHRGAAGGGGDIKGLNPDGTTYTSSTYHIRKTAWFVGADRAGKMVVFEGGINALSWAQLNKLPANVAYAATGGSCGRERLTMIAEEAKRRGASVIISGFDADAPGDATDAKLQEVCKTVGIVYRRDRPSLKDWNDVLRAQLAEAAEKPSEAAQREAQDDRQAPSKAETRAEQTAALATAQQRNAMQQAARARAACRAR